MIFLILQIFLLSSFGLIVKHYQTLGRNLLAIGAMNYAFAAIAAAISVIYKGSFEFSVTACILGVLAGLAYFTAYYLMINAIRISGISIAWSAVRLSVLVPILFSIFYWHEQPGVYQIMGIVSVCIALPLLSVRPNDDGGRRMFGRASILVIALFIASGGVNLAPKAFDELCPDSHRQMYLLFLFGTAAIASGSASLLKGSLPQALDLPVGAVLGLLNLSARHFLLLALTRLPDIVVFPISGSVGIVLIALAGMVIWREKLRTLNILGIAFAVITVILISLK